jgi:hypothetical protein
MRAWLMSGLAILLSANAFADVVTTKSGNSIECVVIQENADSIVIRRGYGTMTYPRTAIASVKKSPVLTESSIGPTTRPTPGQRVPGWSDVLASLVKAKWATNVQQIPATVVDVGVMRHVPYQSYRCGTDYEINIYGDPDHPASIEIGVYRTLLTSAEAKRNCIEFIASILPDKTDAAIVRALNQAKDLVTRDEWTTEITPATAPDAYGGWWVSVYNEKQLDAARATDEEMKQITVARSTPAPATPKPVNNTGRSVVVTPIAPAAQPQTTDTDAWTPSDMALSRPSSTSGGGSVYVRGYFRKDGTYVHSYARRR